MNSIPGFKRAKRKDTMHQCLGEYGSMGRDTCLRYCSDEMRSECELIFKEREST